MPVGPVVLGIILGGPLEERFIQAMTESGGSPVVFFARPAAAVLGMVAIGVWLLPALVAWRTPRRLDQTRVPAVVSRRFEGSGR